MRSSTINSIMSGSGGESGLKGVFLDVMDTGCRENSTTKRPGRQFQPSVQARAMSRPDEPASKPHHITAHPRSIIATGWPGCIEFRKASQHIPNGQLDSLLPVAAPSASQGSWQPCGPMSLGPDLAHGIRRAYRQTEQISSNNTVSLYNSNGRRIDPQGVKQPGPDGQYWSQANLSLPYLTTPFSSNQGGDSQTVVDHEILGPDRPGPEGMVPGRGLDSFKAVVVLQGSVAQCEAFLRGVVNAATGNSSSNYPGHKPDVNTPNSFCCLSALASPRSCSGGFRSSPLKPATSSKALETNISAHIPSHAKTLANDTSASCLDTLGIAEYISPLWSSSKDSWYMSQAARSVEFMTEIMVMRSGSNQAASWTHGFSANTISSSGVWASTRLKLLESAT
ncbi:hypothetical protein BKA56DRAFT_691050 [Ilyonectria sp. MPI-CAGE-AT-0026]|nr:hypothetical protein BKA56DRAFT_691050 [Ilyonectria sp. MPI-CAGE-AT-0026]